MKVYLEKRTSKSTLKPYLVITIDGIMVNFDSRVISRIFDLSPSQYSKYLQGDDGIIQEV